MPGSPASCARRRSRSRRCRSPARAPTSTTATSRSPRRRTARRDDQIAAVRALLAKAPATEDDLELGLQEGRPPREDLPQLLRQARRHARALPRARLADRRLPPARRIPSSRPAPPPTPRRPKQTSEELPTATDGCGVVTFALPLERMAYAFARFEQLPQGDTDRQRDARAPRPRRRPGRRRLPADAHSRRLVREGRRRRPPLRRRPERRSASRSRRRTAPRRPLGPALAAFLEPFGVALPDLATVPVTNSRGEHVGELAVATS